MLTASEGWSTTIMAECVAIGRQAWHIAVAVGRVYILIHRQQAEGEREL